MAALPPFFLSFHFMSSPASNSSSTSYQQYKRLLRYAYRFKVFFAIGIAGFFLYSGAQAMLAMTVEFFFDALQGNISTRIDFLPATLTTSMFFVPAVVVVVSLFRGLGAYFGNFYLALVGLKVVNGLRKDVFAHMLYLPQSYYDKHSSGELVSLIIYNIEQVTNSVTEAVKILVRDGLQVAFVLALLLYYNWKLTLVFFAVAPLLAGLIYVASRYFLRTSRKIQHAVGRVTHIATESFQGIKLVKSFRGEKYENARFQDAANDNLRFATKFERVKSIQTPVLHLIVSCALAAIMLLVLLFWDSTPAAAVAYVTAAGMIAKPFRSLTNVNAIIQRGIAASETIFSTIDLPQQIDSGTTELHDVKGHIEIKGLSFGYNSEELALDNFSLEINPGETVALVGESGSGKSTLANLLLRFYTAEKGEILIDGQTISDISLASLRANIALVNQNTVLFDDAVSANIAYGEDLETATLDQVAEAAKHAHAHNFIEELDENYRCNIGESGSRLSGGQRQRLSIARAILKNAPILILDEATSALDNESEKKIQDALETLKQGRTTLVIAHRLSTIVNADKIAVMEKGRIVEIGTHETLLAKSGAYNKLYSLSEV